MRATILALAALLQPIQGWRAPARYAATPRPLGRLRAAPAVEPPKPAPAPAGNVIAQRRLIGVLAFNAGLADIASGRVDDQIDATPLIFPGAPRGATQTRAPSTID